MNNSETLKTVGAAKYYGLLEALTPENMKVEYSSHSTGEHLYIYLTLPEKPPLLVWYNTNWFHSCYEFNERDKVHGFQPECGFAVPVLSDFFKKVEAAVQQRREEIERNKREREEQIAAEKAAHLEAYKSHFAA